MAKFYSCSPTMLILAAHLCSLLAVRVLGQEPRFNVVTKNVTVVAGHTAVLPCSVDYLGRYKVHWMSPNGKSLTLDDRRIISDERISVERPYVKEWNLHIRKVKTSDAGTYMCQINTEPVQVRPIMLHVHEPSKIIDHLSSGPTVTVREGDTVELVCNVTGFPAPSVTWYRIHSGLMEDEDDRGKKRVGAEGEVLVIHNVSRYCDDKYECVAYNGVAPADTREMRVHVEFPPEIRLPNRKIGQVRGKPTILECEITAYPQILTVWRRNGEDITRSVKHSTEIYNEGGNKVTLSLKIQSVELADYGEYECYSHNLLGSDSETMILYEYRKPEEKTTTTTTTTTTEPSWFQNVNHQNGQSSHDRGRNSQWTVNGAPGDQSSRDSWSQNNKGAENSRTAENQEAGEDNYPPYNKWRNPEYSYEPEAESNSVIADPKNKAETRISSLPTILHLVVFVLLLCWLR